MKLAADKHGNSLVNIKLTHYTEDGKLITIPFVPGDYRNTNKGLAVVKEPMWFPVLFHSPDRSDPCRMPLGLLNQRLPEDKGRQASERRELDKNTILALKKQAAEGMTIHVEG